ncbi:hypothetical protein [Mycobacterium sp. 94-17]|uniref:hypothetical protein n=1 Tax=Mycobacterium sp. 94-17 TaxID=2986147 RepID=UPI002D1F4EE0|nr:hypothetical protein [Mycobacterium sp. 94-17]MEB4210801.1 hypothetical protein [Mycobacterium sp. 94-17]
MNSERQIWPMPLPGYPEWTTPNDDFEDLLRGWGSGDVAVTRRYSRALGIQEKITDW